MTVEKYIPTIKSAIHSFDPAGRNRYFIFGSSTRKNKFNDIDLGFVGGSQFPLHSTAIKEKIESTTIPFFVDVVDFDASTNSFQEYVFNNENIIWIN